MVLRSSSSLEARILDFRPFRVKLLSENSIWRQGWLTGFPRVMGGAGFLLICFEFYWKQSFYEFLKPSVLYTARQNIYGRDTSLWIAKSTLLRWFLHWATFPQSFKIDFFFPAFLLFVESMWNKINNGK